MRHTFRFIFATLLLMAATIVSNIAVFADQSGHGNQSHLVYAANTARWLLLYDDSKTANTIKAMMSSSNDLASATWAAPSSGAASPAMARSMSTNDQRNVGVLGVANGTTDAVHVDVGIQATGGIGYEEHIRLTVTGTSALTWDASWNEAATAGAVSAPAAIKGNTVGLSSSGAIHSVTCLGSGSTTSAGVNGDPNARLSSSADTGSSWTNGFDSRTSIDDGMSFQCNSFALAPLASGAMLVVYENAASSNVNCTGLRYNKYASGTTWPNNTGAADVGIGTSTQNENDWCLCAVDTTHIYAFRRDSTSAIKCRIYNGATWSTPTSTIPAAAVKAGSGLFAATDGTSLWLFWIDSTGNGAVNYVQGSTANGTISFDATVTTLEVAGSTARNYISGCPTVANNQIGVLYTVVNGTNFDLGLSVLSLSTGVTGTLNQTLADATLSAMGVAPVQAVASIALADATVSATGTVKVAGSLSTTLSDATLAATGSAPVVGSAAVTLAVATLSATAQVPVQGSLSTTLAPATTLSAAAVAPVTGQLAGGQLADATLIATGGSGGINGSLNATLADATCIATATSAVSGSVTATLIDATCTATGAAPVSGYADATLADAAVAATAAVAVRAVASLVLLDAVLAATGRGPMTALPFYYRFFVLGRN